MEDEIRNLPPGWIRQYDAKSDHHFYVDTKAHPPRSIWHHPYDDDTYLKSLSAEERERIEELHRLPPSREDIINAESDTENPNSEFPQELPPRPNKNGPDANPHGLKKYGRKLKDKLTDTTHEQREAERRLHEQQEEEMYRRHQVVRQAMQAAWETGQPQLLGKDNEGRDVYIEPPRSSQFNQFNQSGYGVNPYAGGPYSQPNTRFIPYPEPQYPYTGRPYGYGYGYGMGLPLMGGLAGGALLGGLLF